MNATGSVTLRKAWIRIGFKIKWADTLAVPPTSSGDRRPLTYFDSSVFNDHRYNGARWRHQSCSNSVPYNYIRISMVVIKRTMFNIPASAKDFPVRCPPPGVARWRTGELVWAWRRLTDDVLSHIVHLYADGSEQQQQQPRERYSPSKASIMTSARLSDHPPSRRVW